MNASMNPLNNLGQTPLMLLFVHEGEDEKISSNNKFDPIACLSVFSKQNLKIIDNLGRNVLHYACIRGATISVLTLLDKKVDHAVKDYSGTTPFGYALKNGHEDLCIFMIQKGYSIPEVTPTLEEDEQEEINRCHKYVPLVISAEHFDLLEEYRKKLSNKQLFDAKRLKVEYRSPFDIAMEHKMQGLIYLMIQKDIEPYPLLMSCVKHGNLDFLENLSEKIQSKKFKLDR